MKVCPKCGEQIYVDVGDIEDCPVCGTKLIGAEKGHKKPDRGNDKNIIPEIKSELNEELRPSVGKKKQDKPFNATTNLSSAENLYPTEISHRVVPLREEKLDIVDNVVNENLLLPIGINLMDKDWPTTYYCETLEEYTEQLYLDKEISETTRKWIKEKAQEKGSWGVSLPGRGYFINGWLFARIYGCKNARDVLQHKEGYPQLLGTIAHEKLGHGFIDLFTTVGEELVKIKNKCFYLGEHFYEKPADTPEWTLLTEKWNTLFSIMQFTQEGYATWVETYTLEDVQRKDKKRRYPISPRITYNHLLKLIDEAEDMMKAEEEKQTLEILGDALRCIYEDEEANDLQIHASIMLLQQSGDIIDKIVHSFDTVWQGYRYDLGYLIMKKVEKKFGTNCVPHAVQIACNVKYNVEQISNADLRNIVTEKPKLNIDTRLALISHLPEGTKNDIEHLSEMARELLNFAI